MSAPAPAARRFSFLRSRWRAVDSIEGYQRVSECDLSPPGTRLRESRGCTVLQIAVYPDFESLGGRDYDGHGPRSRDTTAPEVCQNCVRALLERPTRDPGEGAGKTGCTPHPRSRVHDVLQESAHEHTGSAEASGLPCAMGLRLISYSPRRSGFLASVASRKSFARLDASVEASGPHDLAVRTAGALVRWRTPASTASCPSFVQ